MNKNIVLTFLLVFVAMAFRDVLATIGIIFVVHGQGWLGGLFDGLSDIASVLSIGVEGVIAVKNGWSLTTFVGFIVLFSASVIGIELGVYLKTLLPM